MENTNSKYIFSFNKKNEKRAIPKIRYNTKDRRLKELKENVLFSRQQHGECDEKARAT